MTVPVPEMEVLRAWMRWQKDDPDRDPASPLIGYIQGLATLSKTQWDQEFDKLAQLEKVDLLFVLCLFVAQGAARLRPNAV